MTPANQSSGNNAVGGLISLIVVGGLCWWFFGGSAAFGTNQSYNSASTPTEIAAGSSTGPGNSVIPDESSGAGDLEVLDHKFATGEYGVRTITGRIKNNGSKQYGYAQIQFNLYDAQNNLVGSALANVNNLEPGGTWKYEAAILEDKAVSYKLKEVTGF